MVNFGVVVNLSEAICPVGFQGTSNFTPVHSAADFLPNGRSFPVSLRVINKVGRGRYGS